MGKRGGKSRAITLRGKGPLNAALTATNAGGAFVATRFEIDTTLTPSWDQLGKTFTKWRVKSLTFHFATLKSTTTEGTVGICVLTDPLETTPGTTSSALSMQYSKIANIHQSVSLRYKPVTKSWMFTRDIAGTTDDRIEMPGDVVFFTENTAAVYVPGVPWVTYVVEFCSVANSTVAPLFKSLDEKRAVLAKPNSLTVAKENDNPGDNVASQKQEEALPESSTCLTNNASLVSKEEILVLQARLNFLLQKLGND